jgi:hypothetical protein
VPKKVLGFAQQGTGTGFVLAGDGVTDRSAKLQEPPSDWAISF